MKGLLKSFKGKKLSALLKLLKELLEKINLKKMLDGVDSLIDTLVDGAKGAAKAMKEALEKIKDKMVKKTRGVSDEVAKGVVKINRIDKIEVKFTRNPKHNAEEFTRQLKAQEEGLNNLTVEEYLKNRNNYLSNGRALDGNAAQQIARENSYTEKVTELREQGHSAVDAEVQARKWLDDQAALHNPDQIAGGNPNNIGGMGDRGVNSSLGAQWKSRIHVIDEQVQKSAKNMTEIEKANTYLNVKLLE